MLHTYDDHIGHAHKLADDLIATPELQTLNREQLFSMLIAHSDSLAASQYVIDEETVSDHLKIEPQTVARMLDQFSLPTGSLSGFEIDHLFLGNPIWTKPIIEYGEGHYCCVMPQLFFSFVFPALESLLADDAQATLAQRRADFLEQKVKEVVSRQIPLDSVVSNLKWTVDSIEYETDLVAIVDSHLLIVEAKSGRVSSPALRGAPDRVQKHLEELLIAPNVRSKRLQDRLYTLIADPSLKDPLRDSLYLDRVHRIVRVSITLEDFATIQSNVARLGEIGWLPEEFVTCPTMSIADFETLIDLLDRPVHIVNYLDARQVLEERYGYLGDELDLMGLYLETLFNLGSIDQTADILITGMSQSIDVYYNSRDAGIVLEKPKPRVSPLFDTILSLLERRAFPRWTELASILLRVSPDDQVLFDDKLRKLEIRVRKHWEEEGHTNTLVCSPLALGSWAICFVLLVDRNFASRSQHMENAAKFAFETPRVMQCLVIARNIDEPTQPYCSIGLFDRNDGAET